MRAESVALYLATNKQILEIFSYKSQQDQDDLAYYMFLVMVRAGVRALEFYDPATGKHGQAQCVLPGSSRAHFSTDNPAAVLPS